MTLESSRTPTPTPSTSDSSDEESPFDLSKLRFARLGENQGSVPVGSYEVWVYDGRRGETMTVSTEAAWDTILTLFDEEANPLAVNDDIERIRNTQSRIEYQFTQDGLYFILVGSYERRYGGDYKLLIEISRQGF